QALLLERATLDGDVFADDVVVADLDAGGLVALRRLVLRDLAERGELEYLVVAAHGHGAVEHHVRADPATLADGDAGADHRVGADLDRFVQLGLGVDDCRRMDAAHDDAVASAAGVPSAFGGSLNTHIRSASAASSPSTVARVLKRHRLRLILSIATES